MHSLNLPPSLSLQARGRVQAAKREVRALLDLIRENQAAVQHTRVSARECQNVLHYACVHLKILDQKRGDKELIKSLTAEHAKLRRA